MVTFCLKRSIKQDGKNYVGLSLLEGNYSVVDKEDKRGNISD